MASPDQLRPCFTMYKSDNVMAIFDACIKYNTRRHVVAGEKVTAKTCADSTTTGLDFIGCQSATYEGITAKVCVCETPLCNSGPVTPGSCGIILVAMVISFITTAHLM